MFEFFKEITGKFCDWVYSFFRVDEKNKSRSEQNKNESRSQKNKSYSSLYYCSGPNVEDCLKDEKKYEILKDDKKYEILSTASSNSITRTSSTKDLYDNKYDRPTQNQGVSSTNVQPNVGIEH